MFAHWQYSTRDLNCSRHTPGGRLNHWALWCGMWPLWCWLPNKQQKKHLCPHSQTQGSRRARAGVSGLDSRPSHTAEETGCHWSGCPSTRLTFRGQRSDWLVRLQHVTEGGGKPNHFSLPPPSPPHTPLPSLSLSLSLSL